MAATSEQDMRQLAQRTLGMPFLAAAAFRTVVDVELRGGLAGVLVTFGRWAWIKKRSRLPPYPFVIVTEDELIVLEFDWGSTLHRKRVVGRWPKTDIRILEASPEHRRATVAIPSTRSPVELEGAFGSDAEREVVSRLRELSTET